MPCSTKAWYDVTPEAGKRISRGHVNHLSNSNIQYMKIQTKCSVLLFALVSAALGLVGCGGYYSTYPGYGPYYGGGYGGGPVYGGPYYGGYPGSVTVEVGDRPYYRHGAGYYVGRTYYVWKPGHWASRNGQRVWIHGHYVVRGGY
jgi:hypothetical protein